MEAFLRTDFAFWAGDHHDITIRIAEPDFSVFRCRIEVGLGFIDLLLCSE